MALLLHSSGWNFFAASHRKGAVDEIREDMSNTALNKWLVIKNLADSVDAAEHCPEYSTILKCAKKNFLSNVKKRDKDTSDCLGVISTHKMHCVKVFPLYLTQAKEHRYSIKARSQHTFKSS